MTQEFIKGVCDIDRKIQGRILQAISDLSKDPMTPRGDTIKPLGNELEAAWRYRIGDYRMIYLPDSGNKHITLLSFAGRGQVYNE